VAGFSADGRAFRCTPGNVEKGMRASLRHAGNVRRADSNSPPAWANLATSLPIAIRCVRLSPVRHTFDGLAVDGHPPLEYLARSYRISSGPFEIHHGFSKSARAPRVFRTTRRDLLMRGGSLHQSHDEEDTMAQFSNTEDEVLPSTTLRSAWSAMESDKCPNTGRPCPNWGLG